MLFETNFGKKGTQEYSIGICGLTGCTVKRDVNSLFSRLKALINDQTLIAVQIFDSDRIATHLHLLVMLCMLWMPSEPPGIFQELWELKYCFTRRPNAK